MIKLWYFASGHPVAAFFMLWLAAWLLATVYSRTMRMLMVVRAGWPPAHLDADGDWKPETDE